MIWLALCVACSTYKVHWIEVGGLLHECRVGDLARLQDLARDSTISFAHEEWTTTRFARILHYAAYAQWALELGFLFGCEVRILQFVEHFLLLGNQHTRKELLIAHGVAFEAIWHHIVDILDEDDIRVLLVEILDERTVSTWTEE